MRDDDARNRLLDTLEGVPAPPRRIDDVLRRMRARRTSVVRWRRRASWFVASALVFTGVVLPVAPYFLLGGPDEESTGQQRRGAPQSSSWR